MYRLSRFCFWNLKSIRSQQARLAVTVSRMTTSSVPLARLIAGCVMLMLLTVLIPQFCLAKKTGIVKTKGQPQTAQPKITILSPKPMQTFGHDPVVVNVLVENFKLQQPEPFFGEPNPRPLGHIHYYLDSNPVIATSSRKIMLGSNIDGENLKPGEHSLTAELVHDNHTPLNPRVYKRVVFLVKDFSSNDKSAGSDGDAGLSGHVK